MSLASRGMHVLIVTFGYEPLAHVSTKRPSRMARELVRLGFEVTVVTVDWRRGRSGPARPLDQAVAEALAAPAPRVVAVDGRLCDPGFDPDRVPKTTEPAGPRHPLLRRMRTMVDTVGWGSYPRWARLAYAAARAVHRRNPVDVTWAIHGDDSAHEVAYRLHRTDGVPWAADFKDPWDNFHSALARPVQRWATLRRVRSAEVVTETCAAQGASDAATFGRPVEVVYSGYDPATMAAAAPERPGDGFAVTYLGNVGPQHDAALFASVFAGLARRGALERGRVQIHQFSHLPGQVIRLLADAVPANAVVEHDWADERRAFGLMKGSDCLLMLPASRSVGRLVGVKEIETYASGTPVLHLGAPFAEMEAVVRACPQVRVGRTVEEGIAAFEDVLVAARRGPVNGPALAGFSWSIQAERLAEVLAAAASSGRRRPVGP